MSSPQNILYDPQGIAYCGTPPTTDTIVSSWNFDPPLLIALGVFAYCIFNYTKSPVCGWSAFALAVLIFVSPLCSLSSALFSARVVHHVILIAAIAPLIIKSFPQLRIPLNIPSAFLFALHMIVLWIWHAPMPYVWALSTVGGYWFMQATLFLTAAGLWYAIFQHGKGTSIMLLLGTVAQMGLLGALIVFAPEALYSVHEGTTIPWGLTQIEDQQLAGLIMWLPAILPYFIFAMTTGWDYLREDQPA